ncbi:MAG: hypothetical protein M1274_09020 [Actinobacteria bacterium]|nr:hypothetical protein [Actinomycetota bacterium]
MRKRLVVVLVLALVLALAITVPALAKQPPDKGFDEFGYNQTASVFVGTGQSWGLGKGLTQAYIDSYLGDYQFDKLVMNWNAEWNRGNEEGWANPPYDAWCTNQWIGTYTGENEHYKIIWVGTDLEDSPYWVEGGYAVWGQFEVIFDRYQYADGSSEWFAHAAPAGLGGILN